MKIRDEIPMLEQLKQIARTPIWDGDLISKSRTEDLHTAELIDRCNGFSFITGQGIDLLDKIGAIQR